MNIFKGFSLSGVGTTDVESDPADGIEELHEFGCQVEVADPWADAGEIAHEYHGLKLADFATAVKQMTVAGGYAAVIVAVAHRQMRELDFALVDRSKTVLYDIKGILPKPLVDGRL
jgi:UDP-N-acetyl-D-galactosamine dehydrogenase